jgi:hypothetical protein
MCWWEVVCASIEDVLLRVSDLALHVYCCIHCVCGTACEINRLHTGSFKAHFYYNNCWAKAMHGRAQNHLNALVQAAMVLRA